MRATTVILATALALTVPGSVLGAPPPATAASKHKLKPGANGALCLECHATFVDVLKKSSVHTPVKSKDCIGCHNPHATDQGKLLPADPNQICATCHDVVPKAAKTVHAPLKDKGCTSCHDPHASSAKNNLLVGGNALCAGCHKTVVQAAGTAKFKHRPVEQSCTTCHDPHGSTSEDLLRQGVPALCVKCHKTEGQIFTKAHMGYPVGKSRCTSCHDPHGSDKRGMLYNRVHSPVAKGMCNQCHEAPSSPRGFAPKVGAPDLCRGCHAQKLEAMLGKNRIHQPIMEGDSCLSCHSPHASSRPGLIKGNLVNTCGSCHADTIKRQAITPTKHEPVLEGNCAACHDPHSGDAMLLLSKPTVVETCGSCHDWLKHSSHPMGEDVKDPRNKNLSIQCLSCHRSHGTEHKHMLPYPTVSDLCTKCHEQFKR